MVQYFDEISPSLEKWMENQHVFWVATAPLAGEGHVNVSPKGGEGMFHIVNPRQVWYEDLTGSGIETISHLRENGRITVLFNAFEGPPRIARLYGRGTAYEFGTPEYNNYISPESRKPGSRAVIVVDVFKVGTSCGYSVPFFDFKSYRTRLLTWATTKERADKEADAEGDDKVANGLVDGLKRYWNTKNLRSLDGMPGLLVAPYTDQKIPGLNKDADAFKPDDESLRKGNTYAKLMNNVNVSVANVVVGFAMGVATMSLYMRASK
uniref:Pyridoxamine phosphate oxidase n=1 Tax=Mycena chlorophos TaxID=658473 RepID=A0ABQ0LMK9_MYCCL|nr:pyridoxamine phosphate oxidase [Mycena chlorophos]